jgi:HK97 family phage prohead protease
MPKKEMETRNYSVDFETREEGESGILEGRPIVYGQRADIGGWFEEVIEPGALDSTDLTDVRLCLNHDTSFVYARSRRNNPNSTMQLFTDAEGLRFRAGLAIKESAAAKDLYSAVSRKDIDKMSFMFSIDSEWWENLESDYPTRHITKIGTVVEISAVTFPAYQATSINARGKEALESARSAVETARAAEAAKVDTEAKYSLELEKAKFNFYKKIGGNSK